MPLVTVLRTSFFKIAPLIVAFALFVATAKAEAVKPTPQQPYSPLSPMPGGNDATRVSKLCVFLGGMSTDSFKSSELEVARTYALSIYNVCLAHAMPADWPDAPAALKRGQELFHQAQAQKPDLVNPEAFSATFDKIRASTPRH
jgi:hypothetical protein